MQDDLIARRRDELVAKLEMQRAQRHHVLPDEGALRVRYENTFDRLIALDALEAQARLARSQEQLAASQHEAAEAQVAETKRLEKARSLSDNQNFWFRRFLTSLTVAHGAGAFAALTSLMRTPPPVATPHQSNTVLWCFLSGLFLMGSLPIAYALIDPEKPDPVRVKNSTPVAWMFAGVSTLLLALGIFTVLQVAIATYHRNTSPQGQPVADHVVATGVAKAPASAVD